jgi:hypothetical protein
VQGHRGAPRICFIAVISLFPKGEIRKFPLEGREDNEYFKVLLNSGQNAEECDARDDDSSNAAGFIIYIVVGKRFTFL